MLGLQCDGKPWGSLLAAGSFCVILWLDPLLAQRALGGLVSEGVVF